MALAIGLNSGSSFDGLDAVLVEIQPSEDGYPQRPKFVDGLAYEWPPEIGSRVLAAFQNKVDLFEFTRLNYEAGAVYAQAALELLDRHGLTGADIEVVGYDGQTVYQEPPVRATMREINPDAPLFRRWHGGGYPAGLQLGEPSVVAALVDAPTVTQFRPLDHALGGNGAPLMQFLDYVSFRDSGPIITLNIGGIANIQVVNRDRRRMMAFDTGPGNVMVDFAMRRFFDKEYDEDGETAATGTVDTDILAELLAHPFLQVEPPRSAWRLDFGEDFARDLLDRHPDVAPADIVATLTRYSAETITIAIRDRVPLREGVTEVLASGGGTRNATLLREIADLLRPLGLELVLSDKYGLPAQYKEAIKFATLAWSNLHDLASNIPAASGASTYGILGKLVKAPRQARNTLLSGDAS